MTQPSLGAESTTEARTMALAMFASNVPCFFQLMDPSCEKTALWVAYFTHEETVGCDHDMAWPVCEEHRAAIQRMASPFWRMWLGTPSMPCEKCETPVRLDKVEAV